MGVGCSETALKSVGVDRRGPGGAEELLPVDLVEAEVREAVVLLRDDLRLPEPPQPTALRGHGWPCLPTRPVSIAGASCWSGICFCENTPDLVFNTDP